MKLTLLIFFIIPLQIICQDIQTESVQSLYIETYKDTMKLGSATGFVIKSKTKNYLVTNYHVLTNKNPQNGEWLDPKKPFAPDNIKIMHNAYILGNYVVGSEKLFDIKKNKLWNENKIGKEMVDVVELPLTDTIRAKIYPVNYKTSSYDNVVITVTERIYILGFPLGIKSAPFFPIWKSGLIASEPATDQENKPIIWVDAITYPGMSGSPVYFKTDDTVLLKNGQHGIVMGNTAKFMGVFSHSHKFNVYGALWKASYLENIFDDLP